MSEEFEKGVNLTENSSVLFLMKYFTSTLVISKAYALSLCGRLPLPIGRAARSQWSLTRPVLSSAVEPSAQELMLCVIDK